MSFGALVLLGFGLAMDATAVAATRGLATPKILARHVILVAVLFGGFQAFMPLVGWIVGVRVGPLVQKWDHWIAFALLGLIGSKMIWEARSKKQSDETAQLAADPFGMKVMLVLAVATSIDAFAVGITLPMLNAPFALSLVTIGITTAVLSVLGLFAGHRFGALLGKRLDLAGGLVLIGLGTKILIEHLSLR